MSSTTGGQADDRSTAQLIKDASEQMSRLVRDEMRLAAAEMREKGKRFGTGTGLFGGAGVIAFYGGAALVACAILALALVLDPWLAALLVGLALLAIAGILAAVGKKQLQQATPPVPEETVDSVKTDVRTVQEGLNR